MYPSARRRTNTATKSTATSPYRNSGHVVAAFTVIGDPALNRTQAFVQAVRGAGGGVDVLPYAGILAGKTDWAARLAHRAVRLESPGRYFEVERGLLARGDASGVEARFATVSAAGLRCLQRDRG